MAWWEVEYLHKDIFIRHNGSQKATVPRPMATKQQKQPEINKHTKLQVQ